MPKSAHFLEFRLQASRIVLYFCICVGMTTSHLATADASRALNILLTNDDGYDAIGIQTMKEVLRAAGHNVTVVAPSSQRSGSSAAVNLEPVEFQQIGPQDWKVDATPATCVFVALTALLSEPPDLVISGTNVGTNLGPGTVFSGTVGATLAARYAYLAGLQNGIPAIAISSEFPVDHVEDTDAFEKHFAQAAQFTVDLLRELYADERMGLSPSVSFNVNYPGIPSKSIKGVLLTHQGESSRYQLKYVKKIVAGKQFLVPENVLGAPRGKDRQGADSKAFLDGYITVTPIDGDYTATGYSNKVIQSVLDNLAP